ncbi:MAG: hypothetical protein ACYDGR_07845 [Candidatus Dormibacteria bacterium]
MPHLTAISMAASLLASIGPLGAIQAHADLAGVSDIYAFTATVTVTSVTPFNSATAAWWEGGAASYSISSFLCSVGYSDPDGISTELAQPCSISGSFSVPTALVCGNGVGSATGGLTLNEYGVDPDTTTVSSYTAALSAGAAALVAPGTETDSGGVLVTAGFTMVPFLPTLPAIAPNLGPCAANFLAVGTITVAELSA